MMVSKLDRFLLALVLLIGSVSCSDRGPIGDPSVDPDKEIALDVTMIYSDSAIIKFVISSPVLEKYDDQGVVVEEFPKGLRIDFYDDQKRVNSWVSAKYALRRASEGTMVLRDSVVLQNETGDRLETSALTWNELEKTITTKKFMRMIQGTTRDTLFGTGFKANIDFTNFQITNFSGRKKYSELSEGL